MLASPLYSGPEGWSATVGVGGCLGGAGKQNILLFVWQVWESVPYLASYISPLLKENRAIPLDPGQLEATWNGPCSSGGRERAAWESGLAPPISLEGWPLPGAEEGQGLGTGRPRAGMQGALAEGRGAWLKLKCSALPAEVASAQGCSLLSILGNVAASVWPCSVHGRGILPFLRLSQGGNQQTSLAWWAPCLPVLQKQIPPATGLASGWHQRSLATQWPPWQARQLGEGQAGGA